ncbi:MAG: ATP-binding protein [Paludibacteraceae bacterium]|nr:ATP-binding protein [Paludibacteraceae bacterium]
MEYISRYIDSLLLQWKCQERRKPLLLRGARQVGKTSAVRHLAEQFDYYIEVDLNEQRQLHTLFEQGLSPEQIAMQMGVILEVPVVAGRTLLFLDEIQACPAAINSLRYFYERFSDLHIIAAGSLLEFTLAELSSFGVGRVESVFMYPLCFDEFLLAVGQQMLLSVIRQASYDKPLVQPVHEKAVQWVRLFMLIGGMPEVIAYYRDTKDLLGCQRLLDTLIVSYADDFKKYSRQANPLLLNKVLLSVAEQHAGKFVYSHVDRLERVLNIKAALQMLCRAGLVIPVTGTAGNGVPLEAEVNDRYRKMLVVDTGLMQRLLHLDVTPTLIDGSADVVNKGVLAEAFVGLELMKQQSAFAPAQLYYWQREERNALAEVDYLAEVKGKVLPIEVKAVAGGRMRSLQMFINAKKTEYGVRLSLDNFSKEGNIRAYPLYAVRNIFINN